MEVMLYSVLLEITRSDDRDGQVYVLEGDLPMPKKKMGKGETNDRQ